MRRSNLIALGLAVAGIAVLGGYYLMTRPGPQPEPVVAVPPGDAPGPYMTITVAGEANGPITIDLSGTDSTPARGADQGPGRGGRV